MSWREILGGMAPADTHPNPQNPHNPQNRGDGVGFEDCEDIGEADTGGGASLDEALAAACRGLPITPAVVRDALAPEDIEDFDKSELPQETLAAFASAVAERIQRQAGQVPQRYRYRAECQRCGPVWLWWPGTFDGCIWCFNRLEGLPIPRP